MADIKALFLAQANSFETVMQAVDKAAKVTGTDDADVAMMLYEQAESPEKSEVTGNIDNLEKVLDVVQFQAEAMCEYVRSALGPIVQHLTEDEAEADEDLLAMLMFVQDRSIKLHNQLDFFFGNFEEGDLKKGFSIARRSAQAMTFAKNAQCEQTVEFVRQLRSRTMNYLQIVTDLHDWLHGMLDLVDKELSAQGVQGVNPVENK